MRAEDYLFQVKKYDSMILNKESERRRWVSIASGIGDFSVSERVQSTRNLHKNQDAILEYIEIEREIKRLKQEREAIIKTLERLPGTEYKILYMLFIQEPEASLKEVAYHFKKSYDWAKWRKGRGLKMLQRIIDEESL